MGPIFQTTNLMFGLGFAIGPQVAKPFLGYYDIVTGNDTFDADLNTTVAAPTADDYEGIQPVQVAYLVVGAMNILMAVVLVLTSAWFGVSTDRCNSVRDVVFQEADGNDDTELIPDEQDAPAKSLSELLESDPKPKQLEPCSRPGCVLVTLIFLAFFMNSGRSILYLGLLYTYLYEYLGWSVGASTFLLTMFHLVRFLVGVIVVPVARWVSPTKLVVFDLASLLLSSTLMLVALEEQAECGILTTVGVMVASLGDSNILPTLITLAEESIHVIAPVMSLFIAAYGVSLMVVGPIAGVLLNSTVESYPALLLALVVACILVLAVYFGIVRWLKSSGHWPQ